MAMALSTETQAAGKGIIVVTGADGFIGRALCAALAASGRPHRRIVRTLPQHPAAGENFALGDLASTPDTDLATAIDGAFAVVHLAARAHTLRDTAADPAAAYHAANVVA